jgi:hypothetical protein
MVYFQINRDSQPEEWEHVAREQKLAFRLKDYRVVAAKPGEKDLTISLGSGQNEQLGFWLYALQKD